MTLCQAVPKRSLCTISLISLKLELLIYPFHKTGNWGSEGLRSFPKVTQTVAEPGLSPRLLSATPAIRTGSLLHSQVLWEIRMAEAGQWRLRLGVENLKLFIPHSSPVTLESATFPPVFPPPTLPQHLRVPGQVPRCPACSCVPSGHCPLLRHSWGWCASIQRQGANWMTTPRTALLVVCQNPQWDCLLPHSPFLIDDHCLFVKVLNDWVQFKYKFLEDRKHVFLF